MADKSLIEWTDATWQPILGCSVTSPGCTNCYAMRLAGTRLRHHPSRSGLTRMSKAGPVWTGEVRLHEPWMDQPLRWRRGRRIFVCAHGDLFHENVPDEWIDRIFAVMALSQQHTFQVLTKRSRRMLDYVHGLIESGRWLLWKHPILGHDIFDPMVATYEMMFSRVWLGVSVEDRARLGRISDLADTPAAFRFISFEPLLEYLGAVDLSDIDLAIVGGESGPGHRPMEGDWARSLQSQCADQAVRFFMKQMSGKAEIPTDLMIREMPGTHQEIPNAQ